MGDLNWQCECCIRFFPENGEVVGVHVKLGNMISLVYLCSKCRSFLEKLIGNKYVELVL